MKKSLAIFIMSLAVLVLPWLLITPASAASCKCFRSSAASEIEVPFTDGSACKHVDDIVQCSQSLGVQTNQASTSTAYGAGAGTAAIVCKAYRDDSCTVLVGSTDPKSTFNPCWIEKTCEDAGGVWDEENQNQPPCRMFGSQPTAKCYVKPQPIKLQVAIPGITRFDEATGRAIIDGGFPQYMAVFYRFFVAMLAVVAVVMVMWGGLKRIMAAGNPTKITDANETIIGAITGLVIALLSYSLLALVNPKLVENSGLRMEKVKPATFGDWCPDTDPTDPSITYFCGDQATVDGRTCIGRVCPAGTGGCYRIDDSGERVNEESGKLKDYKCMEAWQACALITDDNVEGIHGAAGNSYSVYDSACANYSDANGECTWVEHGSVPSVMYTPLMTVWTAEGIFGSDDECEYYSNAYKEAFCNGTAFGGTDLGDPKEECDDLESILGRASAENWAACNKNWCRGYPSWTGGTCVTKWSTILQSWSCESAQ